ncbi:MAG: FAD-dependent oxidoreductase [Oscillospiraceae bacterium]|nr:FAD-dependent oxidoreductase [Oscillospiraceae bacterium]
MRHLIIGASAAGLNAAKTLRHLDPNAEITILSKDEVIHSRCVLHHYLKGKRDLAGLNFVGQDFITEQKLNWKKGVQVTKVDTGKSEVALADGSVVGYDKLLLAAGSSTAFPAGIKNLREAKSGVLGFRNINDAQAIKELAGQANVQNIVVMGAGLVGVDAVDGLLGFGKNISLVESFSHILNRQLDMRAARPYEQAFAMAGVKQYYGTKITELVLDDAGAVKQAELGSGIRIPCDLFIVTSGIKPNVGFLEGSGIALGQTGLDFDGYGKTNIENVFGAGDISGRSPIWPAAVKEGIIAAYNMVGRPLEQTDFFASKATMNFQSVATMSLGLPESPDDSYTVEVDEDQAGNYKKIIHKNGEIVGAIVQGDLSYAGILTQLIREKIDVSKIKKPLFKVDYSDFFGEFVF